MPRAPRPRRCTACGETQYLTDATTDYRESGLENVQLVDAPVWECGNGHQEVEIPNVEQLHGLLTNLVIRKPTALTGSEIRFLRKKLLMSGMVFAKQLGMTPEHLPRLETGRREITPTLDLLVRLAVAWELTRHRQIDFPSDLRPAVSRYEAMPDTGNRRVEHRNDAPPGRQWVSA